MDKPLDLSKKSKKRKPKELFRPFSDDDKNYSSFLYELNDENKFKNIINFSYFNSIYQKEKNIIDKNCLNYPINFFNSFTTSKFHYKNFNQPLPSISPLSNSSTINSSENSLSLISLDNINNFNINQLSNLKNCENTEPIDLCKKKIKLEPEDKQISKKIIFKENLSTKNLFSKIKIEKDLNENLNKCCYCSQLFDQEKSLSKHIKSKHQALEDSSFERLYKCNYCVLTFTRFDMLQRHNRKHTGEKPYECNICYRNFSRSDHLNTHRINHYGLKPYVCNLCPYASSRRDMVSRHLQTHSISGKQLKAYVKTDFAAKQLCKQLSTTKNGILNSIILSKK